VTKHRCFADVWPSPSQLRVNSAGLLQREDGNGRPELIEMAVEDGGDLLDFLNEFGEFFRKDGLDAIGEGFFGLMVDLHKEAVSANGRGGT
jgi:hypothetical protein